VALSGGEGVSYRVGEFVLKRVDDADEAEWTQALLSRTVEDGFRLPKPRPAIESGWVHEGWTASQFLPELHPAAPAWVDVIDAGLRFADAAERARDGGREMLARRRHRWAVADRVAWGEEHVALDAEASEMLEMIEALLGDAPVDEHIVHGDLSGNVFLDPSGDPVILDVSPYLRPRRWAVAIVIADAVLWHDADFALASSFAANPIDRDLLGRGFIFRMVAGLLAGRPRSQAELQPYRSVVSALM
jgi:uncharacterized protein (TIGR02569 family)